jgi:hypothetical protein
MIKVAIEVVNEQGEDLGEIHVELEEYLTSFTDPDLIEHLEDESISEALALFNSTASKLLIECQRRGILEEVMKKAMELQGAPTEGV